MVVICFSLLSIQHYICCQFSDDLEEIEDKIYTFSSRPKSAPRRMKNNFVGGSISGSDSYKQVQQ